MNTTLKDYYKELEELPDGDKRRYKIEAKIIGYKQARQEEVLFLKSMASKYMEEGCKCEVCSSYRNRIKQIEEELSGGKE